MAQASTNPTWLVVEQGLFASSRARPWSRAGGALSPAELLTLCACGAVAALAEVFLKLSLHLPGHAILRAVFPMLCGLALVPRRGAGTIMGLAALAAVLGLRFLGLGLPDEHGGSTGSLTSLLAIGPLLDFAMIGAAPGWRLYARSAAAGLGANLCAFAIHAGPALIGAGGFSGGGSHWRWRLTSHVLCGAVAGLVSAAVWFRFRSHRGDAAAGLISASGRRDGGEPES